MHASIDQLEMLNLFKKKPKKKEPPELMDLDGHPLMEGDEVIAQRYDLGKCKVALEGLQYFYVSDDPENKVSYIKMIDAITGRQKVKKVIEEEN